MFLHSVEFGLDKEYDHAIFEAFFARECFSDFLQVRGFKRCSRCRFHAERKLTFESAPTLSAGCVWAGPGVPP